LVLSRSNTTRKVIRRRKASIFKKPKQQPRQLISSKIIKTNKKTGAMSVKTTKVQSNAVIIRTENFNNKGQLTTATSSFIPKDKIIKKAKTKSKPKGRITRHRPRGNVGAFETFSRTDVGIKQTKGQTISPNRPNKSITIHSDPLTQFSTNSVMQGFVYPKETINDPINFGNIISVKKRDKNLFEDFFS
jgi:hypothetical protein